MATAAPEIRQLDERQEELARSIHEPAIVIDMGAATNPAEPSPQVDGDQSLRKREGTIMRGRGLRPPSADGLPILGRAPGSSNGFIATGLGASGLTLGPYAGSLIAAMAMGEDPPLDVPAFPLGRFDQS